MNLVGKEGNKWHGIKKTAIFVKFVSGIVLRTDFFFWPHLIFTKSMMKYQIVHLCMRRVTSRTRQHFSLFKSLFMKSEYGPFP